MNKVAKKDVYSCFRELEENETKEVDFDIFVKKRPSSIAILAPHGGWIETRTSWIAAQIAGIRGNLYQFEGLKRGQENRLHITAHHFDEPECVALIEKCTTVVAIHGCKQKHGPICIGGRDEELKARLAYELMKAKFTFKLEGHPFLGQEVKNICNRGAGLRGVQFELSKPFRRGPRIYEFIRIVRRVIFNGAKSPVTSLKK